MRNTGNVRWTKSKTTGHWSVVERTPFGDRTTTTGVADKAVARKMLRFHKNKSAVESTGATTKNAAVMQAWRRERLNGTLAERSIENYFTQVNAFMEFCGFLNESPSVIESRDVARWVNQIDGRKKSTKSLRLIALKDYLDYCEESGMSRGNVARIVKRVNLSLLSHEQKEPKRKTPFTIEGVNKLADFLRQEIAECQEEEALRIAVNPPASRPVQQRCRTLEFWLSAIIIARYTALRVGDIAEMEKASVTEDLLIIHTDKSNRRVEIPMTDELRLHCRSVTPNNTKWLFPEQCALQRSKSRSLLSDQFRRILDKAGVTGLSFHSIRSTALLDAVERFMAAGKTRDEAVAMAARMAGHAGTETTRRHYL